MKTNHGTMLPCIYCGAPESTSDHVPSSKFFPEPRPSDLITVPSCSTCNGSISADEEYFLNWMLFPEESVTPAALATREERFKDITPRRLRMMERLMKNVRFGDWIAPNGEKVGHGPILTSEREVLERVFEKIVRGLYWHEYRETLPLDRKTDSKKDRDGALLDHPDIQGALSVGQGRDIGDDAFSYRIVRTTDGSCTGFVVMVFFGAVVILTTFAPQDEIEARRAARRRPQTEARPPDE